ncbi:GNAT family N-acetyltransferase [Sphingomonas japonica]|uniref:CelD/BcsL family acetyltransferase involved in cellulose biosynthesis n=1 Tax=Sphingomonas japonica TaxID=511662 RepID=A0ABX0U2Y9_9SPHN|nr:GNAT family N-acetyltransferase [Sphingomonas japonica]NIJ24415.1 CelD/BcsL family acetyltransferase involved in cellulose biosynthesis [Sphingomonas japonica]
MRGAIVSLAELGREHAAAWDDCAANAAEPNPFTERWFTMAGVNHLPGAATIQAVVAFDGPRIAGLMPIERHRSYYRLPVANLQNWVHANAFLGGPLLRAGQEQAAWDAMLSALDASAGPAALLHCTAIVEDGPVHRAMCTVAAARGRRCDVVQRVERALLASDLDAARYYETTVRKKKRKELKRLANRLGELGTVTTRRIAAHDDIDEWCDAFLALERSGWKGRAGSALGSDPAKDGFFRAALTQAHAMGRLEILRLELDGRPLAMLVNFLSPPGSASFKIAFDEEFARFSPGVLVQLDNYAILDRPDIAWMDSCAAENHPMINSLWAERRGIVRVSIPLAGWHRRIRFAAARALETGYASLKARRASPSPPKQVDDDD